jgi:hypothetical protein
VLATFRPEEREAVDAAVAQAADAIVRFVESSEANSAPSPPALLGLPKWASQR